jgi:hypothetical protein
MSVGFSVLIIAQSWAMGVSPEKMKAYADIYPDLFQSTTQTVSYHGGGGKNQAVNLLLESFNGNTNVEELSAVLKPTYYTPSSLRSEGQIKQILAAKGLTWEEYQELTKTIAKDPAQFQQFIAQVNAAQAQRSLVSKAENDPAFMQNLHSPEHKAIVKNLISYLKK